MKAIHGGKTKNDKIDSYKIAALLRGGNFPTAYPYPAKMRATKDLLRRRMYIARRCGELVAHIQNTNTQYNLPHRSARPLYVTPYSHQNLKNSSPRIAVHSLFVFTKLYICDKLHKFFKKAYPDVSSLRK
jgi:hypothetical protein